MPILLATMLWFLSSETLFGQSPIDSDSEPAMMLDRVVVRQGLSDGTFDNLWKPLRTSVWSGHVLDWNTNELTIETANAEGGESTPTRIPSDQIQSVDPVWQGQGTAEVVELFNQRKYVEFIQHLKTLETPKIPRWQQAIILCMVIRASDAVQGATVAGPQFLKLAESAPMVLFADLPLNWTGSEADANLEKASLAWLDSADETAQLLGASWLVGGRHAKRARDTIVRLKSSKHAALAQLASAQAWRFVPPPDTIEQLPNWLAFRDRMLVPLALGPTEFLADRLERIGEVDLALGQYAWIATHHGNRVYRAERALSSAAKLMNANGRTAEAEKIIAWKEELK